MIRFSLSLMVVALSASVALADAEFVPGEFVVKLKKEYRARSMDSLEAVLGSEVLQVMSPESNAVLIRRPVVESEASVRHRFADNRYVEYVEPNYIYHINKLPNDTAFGKLWGMQNTGQVDPKGVKGVAGIDIGAEKAWDLTTGSGNVVVAIVDTGIYQKHEDLADNVWVNQAEKDGKAGVDDDNNGFVDDVYGWDFANNKPNGTDDHSHGSHCAGTIGGAGDNGKGVTGVNWKVKMMASKFLDSQGSGTLANAVSAIDYTVKMGAMISSNSWGGGGFSQTLYDAIDRGRKAGQLFVAAAGNESNDNDSSPSYPAAYKLDNIIAVAAVNNKGDLASFSNYGKTSVHVGAPGVNIWSSVSKGTSAYDSFSGTSMATPHVSGVAALLKSYDPSLTYAQLKKRIMDTAVRIPSLKNKTVSGGFINAYNALANVLPPPNPDDPDNWTKEVVTISTAHPYPNSLDKTYDVTIPGAKKIAVYFDRFEVERQFGNSIFDKAEFFDGQGNSLGVWVGHHNGEFSPTATGDTIKVKITTDNTVQEYGFDITKAAVLY